MRVNVCDPCLTEGKVSKADWVRRYKHGPSRVNVQLCGTHRATKLTMKEAEDMGWKAEAAFAALKG